LRRFRSPSSPCQAVRIEPKEPGSIGHLDPQTIENLRKLAEKGISIAGQLETALGAFELLWRDARAGELEKLEKASHLWLELLGATDDPEIKKRIHEISGRDMANFKV
jgi:hypothetical protein